MKQTPLQLAKNQLADRIDNQIRNTRTWRTMALGAFALLFVSVGGNIYQGLTSRIKAVVVEVTGEGQVLRVVDTTAVDDPDTPAVKSYLATWIRSCRSVVGDRPIQEQFHKDCMTFIKPSSHAHSLLNDYYRNNNPLERQAVERVSINVVDVLKQGKYDNAYWIIWNEKIQPFAGERPTEQKKRALVIFERTFLSNEDEVRVNPYGIFIKELDWSDYYEPTA